MLVIVLYCDYTSTELRVCILDGHIGLHFKRFPHCALLLFMHQKYETLDESAADTHSLGNNVPFWCEQQTIEI